MILPPVGRLGKPYTLTQQLQELSTTMNADESVARGCALQAAMLSPLYKACRPSFF